MSRITSPWLALLALALDPAFAQSPPPEMPSEDPAVSTDVPVQAAPVVQAPGMAIIGDQESPIGLYIMPWRGSAAEGGLDRPARLLDDALLPLDPDVFRRQVEYHRALSEHLEKQGLITPE